MQATLDKRIYRLSIDCVLDTKGQVWQAVDVTREVHGQLSLTLDTAPFEQRIYCYTTDEGWRACNRKGDDIIVTDSEILAYLAEVRQALDGTQG